MKILYDGYIYTLQSAGGINRYFADTLSSLPPAHSSLLMTCLTRPLQFPTHQSLQLVCYPRFGFWPGRLSYWAEKHYFRMKAKAFAPDIFHPTYHLTLMRQPLRALGVPVVLTVYDCLHERYPEELDRSGIERKAKANSIDEADRIIVISESTKRDLLHFYNVDPKKVSLIYPGLHDDFMKNNHADDGGESRKDYFMFVGNRWSYKGFDIALKALHQLKQKHLRAQLKVIGIQARVEELALIAELGIDDCVEFVGQVSDDVLRKFYSNSIALLFPSRYEGFGYPALEAMACGAPVIAQKISSLPEVVGDGGVLVEPDSIDGIALAMERMMTDSTHRLELSQRAIQQAQRFKLSTSVESICGVYQQLV